MAVGIKQRNPGLTILKETLSIHASFTVDKFTQHVQFAFLAFICGMRTKEKKKIEKILNFGLELLTGLVQKD